MSLLITNKVEMIRTSTGEVEDVAVYLSEESRPHWGTHEHHGIFSTGKILIPARGFELIDGLVLLALANLRGVNPIRDGFWFDSDRKRINLDRAIRDETTRTALNAAITEAFAKYSIRIHHSPSGLNQGWPDQLAMVQVANEIAGDWSDKHFQPFEDRSKDLPEGFEP